MIGTPALLRLYICRQKIISSSRSTCLRRRLSLSWANTSLSLACACSSMVSGVMRSANSSLARLSAEPASRLPMILPPWASRPVKRYRLTALPPGAICSPSGHPFIGQGGTDFQHFIHAGDPGQGVVQRTGGQRPVVGTGLGRFGKALRVIAAQGGDHAVIHFQQFIHPHATGITGVVALVTPCAT